MDEAAKTVRPELEQNWENWSLQELAGWWYQNRDTVGHRRLGRMLIDVAGVANAGTWIEIIDE